MDYTLVPLWAMSPGRNVLLYKRLVKEACSLGVNILLQKTNN